MGMRSEKLHGLPLEAGKERIMELLSGDDDISVVVEKHGDVVRYATMRAYDPETTSLIEAAGERSRQLKAQGYTRDDFFDDMESVQDELQGLQKTD